MNKIKILDYEVGYTDLLFKKGVLKYEIEFLLDTMYEFMALNKIPTDGEKYAKFIKTKGIQVAYAYHGDDYHEFAIVKLRNNNINVIDRVFCSVEIVDDEGDEMAIFKVEGNSVIAKYSPVRKIIHLPILNDSPKIFDPEMMLKSILK